LADNRLKTAKITAKNFYNLYTYVRTTWVDDRKQQKNVLGLSYTCVEFQKKKQFFSAAHLWELDTLRCWLAKIKEFNAVPPRQILTKCSKIKQAYEVLCAKYMRKIWCKNILTLYTDIVIFVLGYFNLNHSMYFLTNM